MRYEFDLSTLFLLLVNLFTIYLVWREQWHILVIMLIYVLQGIIIGVFHYFKVLRIKDFTTEDFYKNFNLQINNKIVDISSMDKETTKRKAAAFFLQGYLGFHFVYLFFLAVFIFIFFDQSSGNSASGSSIQQITSQIFSLYFLVATLGFLFTHGLSFVLYREEQNQQVNLGAFLNEPFMRILPIHVTIIVSAFFMFVLEEQTLAIIFFLGLKTVVDVVLHIRQHKRHEGQLPL